jgi:hypothetical protein
LTVLFRKAPRAVFGDRPSVFWTIGALGGTFIETCALARIAEGQGDWPGALTLYRTAADQDPTRAYAPAILAGLLAERHRCPEARGAWSEALERDRRWRVSRREPGPDWEAIAWAGSILVRACGDRIDPEAAGDEQE